MDIAYLRPVLRRQGIDPLKIEELIAAAEKIPDQFLATRDGAEDEAKALSEAMRSIADDLGVSFDFPNVLARLDSEKMPVHSVYASK
jgi:hypothetical protein